MKVVIDSGIPFIEGRLPENINVVSMPASDIDKEAVKDADALVVRTRTRCDRNLLDGSGVKLVVTATIGTDHIDIPWCQENGIVVRSAPGSNAPGVAQYVFASLFRLGFDPDSHTLGIVGYGNVGRVVAAWANKMGVKTLISDALRQAAGFKDIEYTELEKTLKDSDAVTLHVPLTRSGYFPTLGLIGEEQFRQMKPSAVMVNSSRGGVVDETALKRRIHEGKIRAVTDVWINEPFIDTELALISEIATPHIAGYSAEGKMRATRMALEALHEVMGVDVDLKGLECTPLAGVEVTRDLILNSYDPRVDRDRLLNDIAGFESLRNRYSYRHEPLFFET